MLQRRDIYFIVYVQTITFNHNRFPLLLDHKTLKLSSSKFQMLKNGKKDILISHYSMIDSPIRIIYKVQQCKQNYNYYTDIYMYTFKP